MKQIKKKDLKEVIKLSKKWYDSGDENEDILYHDAVLYDELYLARRKAFGSPYNSLNDIVMCIYRLNSKTPLKTYYKVFEALGYELV